MADTDYQRGHMNIREQESTFQGFMAVGLWSTGITAVAVLYLTLVFAIGMGWLPALIATLVVGIAGGAVVKLPTAWYVALLLMAGAIAVFVGIASLIGVFAG